MTAAETITYLSMLVGHHLFQFSTESDLKQFAKGAAACMMFGFIIMAAILFPREDREHLTKKQLIVLLAKVLFAVMVSAVLAPLTGLIIASFLVFLWTSFSGLLNWIYGFIVVALESLR